MTPPDDVRAIERLQRQYARLNDETRWHEVAELFTEDAQLVRPSDPERPLVGRAAILQSLLARPQGPARQHLVANPEVELVDAQTARARCYSILIVRHGDDGGTVSVGGFEDRLVRVGGHWRFQSRTGFTRFDPVPYSAHKPASQQADSVPPVTVHSAPQPSR